MSQTQADPLQLKAQLLAEIAALPSDLLGTVLDFVRSLQTTPSIPAAGTQTWADFFQIGDAVAALDRPDAETLTAAISAMRR